MNGMRYDGEHATRRRLMTRKNGSFSSSSILLCFLLFSPAAQNEIPDSGRSRDRLRRHTHGPNVSQKKRDECVPATPLQVFIIETYICERPSIRLKLIFFVGVRESADLQAPVTSGRRGSGKWATSLAFCVWPLSICHFVRPPEAPLVQIHFFFFPNLLDTTRSMVSLSRRADAAKRGRTPCGRPSVPSGSFGRNRNVWTFSGFWQAKSGHLSVGGPQLRTWASVKAERLRQRSLAVAKGFVAVSLGAVYDWQ